MSVLPEIPTRHSPTITALRRSGPPRKGTNSTARPSAAKNPRSVEAPGGGGRVHAHPPGGPHRAAPGAGGRGGGRAGGGARRGAGRRGGRPGGGPRVLLGQGPTRPRGGAGGRRFLPPLEPRA